MLKIISSLLLSLALLSQQGMGPGPGTPAASGGAIAIATDGATATNTAVVSSGSPMTYSITIGSGIDRIVFVHVSVQGSATPTVTFGGVSMGTAIKTVNWNFGGDNNFLFAMIAPSSGSNAVVVSLTTSMTVSSEAVSYTGALQTITPDSSNTDNTAGTARTLTTTTVANNCWTLAAVGSSSAAAITAGTGSTLRSTTSGTRSAILDSNGPVTPAGSKSMGVNIGATSLQQGSIIISFAHA